jgi:hypothetical protein
LSTDFQPRRIIMSDPSAGITFRVIQEAMPEYHLAPDLLGGVLTAMPPPPASATAAWRHARISRIIEELAARVPMDAAQGHLAGQIVVTQFLADDMAARIHAPGLALPEMCRLTRTTDDLLRTVARLERALERRQVRVMPFRDVGAVDGFDLEALDGVWCGGATAAGLDPVEPVRLQTGGTVPEPGEAIVGDPYLGPPPSLWAGYRQRQTPVVVEQTEPDRAQTGHTVSGPSMTESGPRAGREGVTVEREGLWSLEIWPARGSASAGAGIATAARDATAVRDKIAHRTTRVTSTPSTTATAVSATPAAATPVAATMAAATMDRQGPRGHSTLDVPRGTAASSRGVRRAPGTTVAA